MVKREPVRTLRMRTMLELIDFAQRLPIARLQLAYSLLARRRG